VIDGVLLGHSTQQAAWGSGRADVAQLGSGHRDEVTGCRVRSASTLAMDRSLEGSPRLRDPSLVGSWRLIDDLMPLS
jgi:hypothetical protein